MTVYYYISLSRFNMQLFSCLFSYLISKGTRWNWKLSTGILHIQQECHSVRTLQAWERRESLIVEPVNSDSPAGTAPEPGTSSEAGGWKRTARHRCGPDITYCCGMNCTALH